jgi:hypothetical protein
MVMKPVLPAVLACALSLPPAVMQAGASNTIVVPATPYKMFPQDWDAYAGRYELSNGQQMVLHRRGLQMYAEITGRPRVQLVAAAENVFVAVDGQLEMTLLNEGDGRISGSVMLMRPGQQPTMAAEHVYQFHAR